MNMIFVLTLVVAAATPQKTAAKKGLLLDDDARPRLVAAALAKPMRLVEPPPAGAVDLMQLDTEKVTAEQRPADKPAPFPPEPKPPM